MRQSDGLIPFSADQQRAIQMLVNAEYYKDTINLKIKNLELTSKGIFIHHNHQKQQLFSREEFIYLLDLIHHPSSPAHINIDFDNNGNIIHYIDNYRVEVLFNAMQVKFIKILCQYIQ